MNDQTRDPGRPERPADADQRLSTTTIAEQPPLTRPGPRAARWPWLLAAVVLAAIALAAWYWFGHGSEEQAKARSKADAAARPMPVVAAKRTTRSCGGRRRGTGLQPSRRGAAKN